MTKREIVRIVLRGGRPPYVPWSFRFTREAKERILKHYGSDDIQSTVDNHIIELGSDIGFFQRVGENSYQDVFGVVWDRSIDKDIGNVSNTVIREHSLKGIRFPDPCDGRFFEDIPEKLEKHGDCFRLFCIGFSLFERAWTLRGGMTNLMYDFYDAPEFVRELMEAIADYNIAQVQEALKYDIDAVYFGDDWGQQHGLLMGYKCWRKFIYPVLKRMYRAVRDAGKYLFIHSCGDVDELFDDLVDIGLNCFNPFQPEVMDIDAMMAGYRGRLSFWGGLSTQKTLPFGTPRQVGDETKHLIALGTPGGLVISPAHSVEGDVPLENMLAFIDTCKDQKNHNARKRQYHP